MLTFLSRTNKKEPVRLALAAIIKDGRRMDYSSNLGPMSVEYVNQKPLTLEITRASSDLKST
ncbi:MAG TPA: hypothetical protein VIP70_11090 [Nitrososphaeraceae archaeon]